MIVKQYHIRADTFLKTFVEQENEKDNTKHVTKIQHIQRKKYNENIQDATKKLYIRCKICIE